MNKKHTFKGFSLVEILVVIAVIAVFATIAYVSFNSTRQKARDTKRISHLSQIGRFFQITCYQPEPGDGTYDLNEIIADLKSKYPDYAKYISDNIWDPSSGNESSAGYTYIVENSGKNCVLYANLEYEDEEITLTDLNSPTTGGRIGVFQGTSPGVNGTNIFYQISK